ncbi:cell division protein ZapA [Aliiroseovarius subalbicans]|uniref:cell division protein ZapA n=1 Tax=Aliiroseovarius subalbicans TaxID=2925840 RepID=UPI001F58E323|nr:cell division protein ZapA [Aliiroseovarius subalbicans]MCI2398806.1 cell division protein ZapA [Aliiroseovarius subalbicans]
MPDVKITIGGRDFEVACQEGEEHFLKSAAAMLDAEASVLTSQIAHLTEPRMLLMSGLMLADKTAGLDDKLKVAEKQLADLTAEIEALKAAPAPEPEKVEVPVIPDVVTDTLAELAARAEAVAAQVEEKAAR